MFEISWSELLILGIVTLIFVGPKELPVFLRTLGRYAGSIKRQANEFRAQFDAAMREAELDSMRKEVEAMQATVNAEVMGVKKSISEAADPSIMGGMMTGPAPSTSPPSMPAVLPPIELATPETSQPLPMPPMPAPPRMDH